MATIVAYKEFKHESGDWSTVPSLVSTSGISGSEGYASVYFGVNIWLCMAIDDARRVYIGIWGNIGDTKGIGTRNPTVIHGSSWWTYFFHKTKKFSFDTGETPSGIKRHYIGEMIGSTGDIYIDWADGARCNALTVGADTSSMNSGWHYCGRLSEDPTEEDYFERDEQNLYYHVCFPVNNSGGDADTTKMNSTMLAFYWPEIFDYFPWARYQTLEGESTYWSHNRKSPTTGSLKRVSASRWTDVKNQMPEGTASDKDKGFRHNGTDFVKSPKEGKNK